MEIRIKFPSHINKLSAPFHRGNALVRKKMNKEDEPIKFNEQFIRQNISQKH